MQNIIGREEEMRALRRCMESDRSEFVIVYGRRRVGKTFLVDSFFEGKYDFSYVGGHRLAKAKQLRGFAKALKKAAGLKLQPKFADWTDAFDALEEYLERLPEDRKKVVFIDEMPWIDTPQSEFVEALEQFWNGWGARRDDIVFVASGSASSWMMDKLVENPGGLHARITCNIYVRPFTLGETRKYLHSRGMRWDNYQILQLYMIIGGVPFYLSLLEPKESLVNNVDRLFFRRNGQLKTEFDELYSAIFNNADRYVEIVKLLFENKQGMTYDEVAKRSGIDGKRLTTVLRNLERCDFVMTYRQFGNKSRGTLYRLVDFYTLFFYKFVENHDGKDEQWWMHNSTTRGVEAWQGTSFELVCMTHLPQIKRALGISGISTSASSWRYVAPKDVPQEKGAQIDLVIDRSDHVVNVCEMKFAKGRFAVSQDYAEAVRGRIQLFRDKTGTTKATLCTFVTTFGTSDGMHNGVIDNEVVAEELFV